MTAMALTAATMPNVLASPQPIKIHRWRAVVSVPAYTKMAAAASCESHRKERIMMIHTAAKICERFRKTPHQGSTNTMKQPTNSLIHIIISSSSSRRRRSSSSSSNHTKELVTIFLPKFFLLMIMAKLMFKSPFLLVSFPYHFSFSFSSIQFSPHNCCFDLSFHSRSSLHHTFVFTTHFQKKIRPLRVLQFFFQFLCFLSFGHTKISKGFM